MTALISESVEPRPQLILAVAAHEQRVEIEQLDLAVAEAVDERTEPHAEADRGGSAGPRLD